MPTATNSLVADALIQTLIWTAILPASSTKLILAIAWRLWRRENWEKESRSAQRSSWPVAIAVAVGYSIAHWGILGGPSSSNESIVWLLVATPIAAFLGTILCAMPTATPRVASAVRWCMRILVTVGVVLLLLWPIWNKASPPYGLFLAGVAAICTLWSVIDTVSKNERGPLLSFALVLLAVATTGVLIFSAVATSAQVIGGLVSALLVIFVAVCVFPSAGVLQSIGPVVAVALGGHWLYALAYASEPKMTFIFLSVAGLSVSILAIPPIVRLSGVRRLIAVAPMAIWLVLATGFAGSAYFSEDLAPSESDDYGYE